MTKCYLPSYLCQGYLSADALLMKKYLLVRWKETRVLIKNVDSFSKALYEELFFKDKKILRQFDLTSS